jgi:anti-sigma regulatory factor (Ser/Thr protein kinase)
MPETTAAPQLAWSRVFTATSAQVQEARRFLAAILDAAPAAADATLCLSELVTNAVVHSHSRKPGGHFTVRAGIRGDLLRVEVHDQGGPWTWPVCRRDGQHGRGLLIVAQLAREWGRAGDSTTGWAVWFDMDVRHPRAPATATAAFTRRTAMTEPGPAAPAQYDAQLMRAIAAELTACGLTTHLTDSRAGLDLTATLSPSGKREAELIIDEDGYAELRYWNPPGTPPAEVTATALRALNAVTRAPQGGEPDPFPGYPIT